MYHRPARTERDPISRLKGAMLSALRYFWIASKGYRLRPWRSPYIRWRMETFFGEQAADLGPGTFFRLLWRERERLERFLRWADERRREQKRRRTG